MKFHAELAHTSMAPTQFRLLNGSVPIEIGVRRDDGFNLSRFNGFLDSEPQGGTPLCRHIKEVVMKIKQMEPELVANNSKCAIVIATDGESSDGNMSQALKQLEGLPVWVVVRLCTDQERIVNYWNEIDTELELNMDVLDDLKGEAEEVTACNPWLNYGEPLHRIREFGVTMKEMDLLDEQKLSMEQARSFIAAVLGGKAADYPHPELDFQGLVAKIEQMQAEQEPIWDPLRSKFLPWIDLKKLNSAYNPKGCVLS